MTKDETIRVVASIRTDLNKDAAALRYLADGGMNLEEEAYTGPKENIEFDLHTAVNLLGRAVQECNLIISKLGGRP